MGILEYNFNIRRQNSTIFLNFLLLSIHLFIFLTILWYSAFEGQSFKEISEGMAFLLASIMGISCYGFFILKKNEYAKLFGDIDGIITSSK